MSDGSAPPSITKEHFYYLQMYYSLSRYCKTYRADTFHAEQSRGEEERPPGDVDHQWYRGESRHVEAADVDRQAAAYQQTEVGDRTKRHQKLHVPDDTNRKYHQEQD